MYIYEYLYLYIYIIYNIYIYIYIYIYTYMQKKDNMTAITYKLGMTVKLNKKLYMI